MIHYVIALKFKQIETNKASLIFNDMKNLQGKKPEK